MNINENVKKIKELVYLYDTVLNHLQSLTDYTNTNEDCYKNKDLIVDLNKSHEDTRNRGRVILSEDLSKLSNNFFYRIMAKDLNKITIQFINVITDLTQDIVDILDENQDTDNKTKLEEVRKKIVDFNNISQKQFRPLKEKIIQLSK